MDERNLNTAISYFRCMIKWCYGCMIAAMLLGGCKGKKEIPDVSSIHISIPVKRFERDFKPADTNHISATLDTLHANYNRFLADYLYNIQGWQPQPDSVVKYAGYFLKDKFYQNIQATVASQFNDFSSVQKEITHSLQFVQYYFPKYALPKAIITFVGPLEGTGCALTYDGVAIGLQSYLGSQFSAYQSEYISQIYPAYKSRRFEKQYIPVDVAKNIINDIYPEEKKARTLIEQMVETGKRMYVLDALLPEAPDSIKLGYTAQQVNDCFKNEANVWTFFVQNNLLFATEPGLIGVYVNDGPNTPEIGADAPGFIGQFVGWQIVKKWMQQHKKLPLAELLQTPPLQLYNEAKYKP